MALNISNFTKIPMPLSQASNVIIAYEGRPTSVVDSILSQVVSSGTRTNYANHNADLILWIYKNYGWREWLFRDWMVELLITDETEWMKAMCATCKDALNAMNRNYDNCPILLAKLTFNIFSHYMLMKKGNNSGVYLSATRYGGIHSSLNHL